MSMILEQKYKAVACGILSFVSSKLRKMSEKNQLKKDHLHAAWKALDDHYLDANFTVKTWAIQLNLTVPYLSKLLRAATKNAAMWHLRDRRLQYAKTLLAQPEMHISEVSTASGFADNNYFSRVFKDKFQLTPTQWRETYPENGNLL
jgi:two-component system, response regulator YesN